MFHGSQNSNSIIPDEDLRKRPHKERNADPQNVSSKRPRVVDFADSSNQQRRPPRDGVRFQPTQATTANDWAKEYNEIADQFEDYRKSASKDRKDWEGRLHRRNEQLTAMVNRLLTNGFPVEKQIVDFCKQFEKDNGPLRTEFGNGAVTVRGTPANTSQRASSRDPRLQKRINQFDNDDYCVMRTQINQLTQEKAHLTCQVTLLDETKKVNERSIAVLQKENKALKSEVSEERVKKEQAENERDMIQNLNKKVIAQMTEKTECISQLNTDATDINLRLKTYQMLNKQQEKEINLLKEDGHAKCKSILTIASHCKAELAALKERLKAEAAEHDINSHFFAENFTFIVEAFDTIKRDYMGRQNVHVPQVSTSKQVDDDVQVLDGGSWCSSSQPVADEAIKLEIMQLKQTVDTLKGDKAKLGRDLDEAKVSWGNVEARLNKTIVQQLTAQPLVCRKCENNETVMKDAVVEMLTKTTDQQQLKLLESEARNQQLEIANVRNEGQIEVMRAKIGALQKSTPT